ncbi:MAG: hypothetical protein BGO82_04110 [Devosia sp. 67-54]|uniref:hypothetical protein n=2 Tax=unclassified Devosia TaxID=196773 RepID=UPI00096A082E|nr:hypothetical protein [Devosia sp. 67-54]OJX19227.1 MAG: hypothetical protein BGO82_04110 [Devosia sp. 67-54]
MFLVQMPPSSAKSGTGAASAAQRKALRPFLGMIDAVLVHGPADFSFSGAVASDDAAAVWTWMVRDVAPDLIDVAAIDDSAISHAAVESLLPELLARARKALLAAESSVELTRRLKTALGGDEVFARLPTVLNALRCRGLLEKAQGFGRAANGMADEAALALALQSMPLSDQPVAALLLQAAVGQVANPTRLVTAAIRIAGAATEPALVRAGFAPLVEAILAHAQDQIPALAQMGTFGDMDLVCRSVDRFHRLMRAVTGYVELNRGSRWSTVGAALIKAASNRVEPKLKDVGPDMNQALRRREGYDRLDSDQVLMALNGLYLLATVRESRDSLAVNATFDQVWAQTGQALEIHLERLLQQGRASPDDAVIAARLDAALKMAEIRFGQDYADTLRRSRDAAVERRA